MTKKNRKKNNAQSVEKESAGAIENPIETRQPETGLDTEVSELRETLIEADQPTPEKESANVDQDIQDGVVETPQMDESKETIQEPIVQESEADSSNEDSLDDILADVRSSLIEEEEAGKSGKKSSWWNRLVKGPSTQETPDAVPPVEPESEALVTAVSPNVEPEIDEDTDVEEIDELIKLLETEDVDVQEKTSDIPIQILPPVEQEAKIDIDELKKQAFATRSEEETKEEISDVRQVALGGEEEVFVEVEAKAEDPWEERIKSVENALRPYRTYIYYGLAFIGVVMAVMASVLIYRGVKQALPTPVVTETVNLPYPTTVTLPGGLNFSLAKGTLKDGSWNPRGPEWLEGTEICRWVALPWSRQLEAAIRTLTPDDTLVLLMSNNDRLSYKVESIQELTPAQLQKMDSSTPCLAVILAKQDSETRWVAVGRP